MKLHFLYHPESDHRRLVEEYVDNARRLRGIDIELVSLETKEGSNMASLYDIVQYPCLILVEDNGQVAKLWQGSELPLLDEVSGYLTS